MVGVPKRAQLSLQEYRLARFHRVQEEGRGVGDVRGQSVAQRGHVRQDLVDTERRLPVEVLEEDILLRECFRKPGTHEGLIEKLVHLDADLQVLVRVERGDARSR